MCVVEALLYVAHDALCSMFDRAGRGLERGMVLNPVVSLLFSLCLV